MVWNLDKLRKNNSCSLRSQFSKDWHTWHVFAETSPTFLQEEGCFLRVVEIFFDPFFSSEQHFRTVANTVANFVTTEFLKSCSTRQSMLCYWHYFCCLYVKTKVYSPSKQEFVTPKIMFMSRFPDGWWEIRETALVPNFFKKRFFSQYF